MTSSSSALPFWSLKPFWSSLKTNWTHHSCTRTSHWYEIGGYWEYLHRIGIISEVLLSQIIRPHLWHCLDWHYHITALWCGHHIWFFSDSALLPTHPAPSPSVPWFWVDGEIQPHGVEIMKTKDVETFLNYPEEWKLGALNTSPLHH